MSFSLNVTLFLLIFLLKPKILNTYLAFLTLEEKSVLYELLENDIDKEWKIVAIKEEKDTVLASHDLFENALDLILVDKW